jgi:hypothetical protein
MSLFGLKVVESDLARERRTEFKVATWATRDKKRRNWRVLRVEIDRPGCFQVGSTLFVHPELARSLTKSIAAGGV